MKHLASAVGVSLLMFLLASPVLADDVGGAAPATQPATQPATYRMTLQTLFGAPTSQYVFILSLPGGVTGITTPEKLHDYLKLTVPAGATLEWAPACCVLGDDEPLQTVEEVEVLSKFCAQQKITFIALPPM